MNWVRRHTLIRNAEAVKGFWFFCQVDLHDNRRNDWQVFFYIGWRISYDEFSDCTKQRANSIKAINIVVRVRLQTSVPHQHIIVLCTDTTVAIRTRTDTAYCVGSVVRPSSQRVLGLNWLCTFRRSINGRSIYIVQLLS